MQKRYMTKRFSEAENIKYLCVSQVKIKGVCERTRKGIVGKEQLGKETYGPGREK